MTFVAVFTTLLAQVSYKEIASGMSPLSLGVIALLLIFSILSWTVIFSKWSTRRQARAADTRFLRAFRKASGLEAMMVASSSSVQRPWWEFLNSAMKKSAGR